MKLTFEEIEEKVDREKHKLNLRCNILYQRILTSQDIRLICQYLKDNPSITALDVSWNNITSEGAIVLAANATLNSLNVSFNSIEDEGAKALAANTNLTSLDVSHNAIAAEGAKALASNNNLTSLNISGNCIENEDFHRFVAMLEVVDKSKRATEVSTITSNATLKTHVVSDSNKGTQGVKIFLNALKNNLVLVNVWHDFKEQEVKNAIEKILARNKLIHAYPHYKKLIVASYSGKGVYKALEAITPLSLFTICALSVISTIVQQSNEKQNKIFKELAQSMPDNVHALLISLRSLRQDLITSLGVASLPHYAIDDSSILSEREAKKLKI